MVGGKSFNHLQLQHFPSAHPPTQPSFPISFSWSSTSASTIEVLVNCKAEKVGGLFDLFSPNFSIMALKSAAP